MSVFIRREMIDQLIQLSDRYNREAGVCADAGAFQAAAVMLAIAFEARLFCTVAMSQHVLEPEGKWPKGDPYRWELGRLVRVVQDAGWLGAGSALEDAVAAINDVRVAAVHPAAHIRDRATFLSEREFGAIFAVLDAANQELAEVIRDLPPLPEGLRGSDG